MSAWETMGTKNPRIAPWIDVGLKWVTQYYKRMDNTRAYVIAMCKSFRHFPPPSWVDMAD
jgi:hypothetical protein